VEYDNKNSGILFKNDYKTTEKHPDYKGSFTDADGEEKDLAAWIRKTAAGKMMLSLKVSDKFVKEQDNQTADAPKAAFVDDDMPF
jgi:hypothetical protein